MLIVITVKGYLRRTAAFTTPVLSSFLEDKINQTDAEVRETEQKIQHHW